MILVLSFNEYEQGTDPVIDWLLYLKANFIKVTIQDLIQTTRNFYIDINKGRIFINEKDITDEIKVIWYRRFESEIITNLDINQHNKQAIRELSLEVEVTINFLKKILFNKKWMPHFDSISLEKPEITFLAEAANILSPKTIITNNKKDVLKLYNIIRKNLIIKPIRHSSYFIDEEYTYSIYTKKLTYREIQSLPDNFVLTLFQECIESELEIRSFYLDGKFYSTAIVTTGESENIDIKQSYQKNSINWMPYQLPKYFENSLDQFLRSINLNTGSLDVLKTKNNEYYLLEINPVGQYSAPSYRCNYMIEEKVANWLINNDEKEN